MELFLWLLVGHFIGDFPFQTTWMAEGKGKRWDINFYHAAVYTASVMVAVKIGMGFFLSWEVLPLILFSHFAIDPLKARYELIKDIWVDQLFHVTVLALIAFSGPWMEPFQVFSIALVMLGLVATSLYMIANMPDKRKI